MEYYKDFRYLKGFIEQQSAMRVSIIALEEILQTVKTSWNQNHDSQLAKITVTVGEPYDMIKNDYYNSLNQHTIVTITADKLVNREIKALDKKLNYVVDEVTRISPKVVTVIATDKLHSLD